MSGFWVDQGTSAGSAKTGVFPSPCVFSLLLIFDVCVLELGLGLYCTFGHVPDVCRGSSICSQSLGCVKVSVWRSEALAAV